MLYVIPFISAAIGWFTNFLAIKMLFHPRRPVNLGLFSLQGIFPKRQPVLAEKLGRMVARDLFSAEQIKAQFMSAESEREIRETIEREVDRYLRGKIQDFHPGNVPFVNRRRLDERIIQVRLQLRDIVCRELDQFTPRMLQRITDKIDAVDVEAIVRDKVANFSNEKLEALLMNVIRTELRFVEISGAVLGFLIGLVQIALVSWTA